MTSSHLNLGLSRRLISTVAATVSIALLAAGCGQPLSTSDGLDSVAAPNGTDWQPQDLPPIPVSKSGGGAQPPVYDYSVVTDKQGLAVSLQPTLEVTSAPADQQYQFSISTVGGQQSQTLWHAQAATNQIRVPAGVLHQGDVYQWQAEQLGGTSYGPYAMTVDQNRTGKQPSQNFGPVEVSLASGAVTMGMSLRSVQGASGKLGVNLSYQLGNPADTGVPAGWMLRGETQGWDHLQIQNDGSVSMVDSSGYVTAYVSNAAGNSYMPVSPIGRAFPTGSLPTLVKNPDGTWTSTMQTGWSAIFGRAGSDGIAYLTESYDGGSAAPSYLLSDDGRITTVQDGISPDLQVSLNYQGSSDCPEIPDGFVDTPDGMLCSVVYPDGGGSTDFFYLETDSQQPVLARVVDYPDTTDSKSSVTDIGYDDAARIVAVREPLAADAQASGVRTDAAALLTTIGYDEQGRADVVTRPAAQQGQTQSVAYIRYLPSSAQGEAIITQNLKRPTSSGYSSKYTYDPATLLQLTNSNAQDQTATRTWNTSQDLPLSDQDHTGRKTTYTYNQSNQLIQQQGPFLGSEPNSQTPKTTYTYDQDLSDNQPKDLHGFNVTYWSDPQLVNVPVGRTFGPKFNNTVPEYVNWTWPQSPTGQNEPWSARLLGLITLPSSSHAGKKSTTQNYSFTLSPENAMLWVDNNDCSGSCTVSLNPGQHQIRIDLPVPVPGANGAESIALRWQLPGEDPQLVPMTAITPNLGQQSISAVNDAYSAQQAYLAQSYAQYDNPADSKPTSVWVQKDPQVVGKSAYESFDPASGQYGRNVSSTLPAGNQLTYDYYGAQDSADIPCTGQSVEQYGRTKAITRTSMPNGSSDGMQTYTNYFDPMGDVIGGKMGQSGDSNGLTSCVTYNDAGQAIESDTPARGDQPATTLKTSYFVNGNPFVASSTVEIDGGPTYHSLIESDLFGRPLSMTDVWGYTTTFTYDDITGNQQTVVTTDPNRQTISNRQYFYSVDGLLQQITLNGQILATIGTATDNGNTLQYGNGVKGNFVLSDIGTLASEQWTTSDGKNFGYAVEKAPSQRILSEQYSFDSSTPNATYAYVYDSLGRLSNASLATASAGLAPSAKAWAYDFGSTSLGTNPDAGLNSNRTKQVITLPDNTTREIDYGYNQQDQLTNTTDPLIGNKIGYSDWGETNQLASLTIDYTATSLVSKIVDSVSGDSVVYQRAGSQLLSKTETTDGVTTTSEYGNDGLILDGNGRPQWQVISLPGGATMIRNMGGAQLWQFQTPRKQTMWVADQNGHDTGTRHLYSPYGEELLANTAQQASGQSESSAPASSAGAVDAGRHRSQSSPAPTATGSSSPTSSESPSSTPSPSPTGDVPMPNLGWQGGNHLETQQLGLMSVINMGARLYIPALGRFVSEDPVIAGSVNAYDYANQDPINQSDPTGSTPLWLTILVNIGVSVLCIASSLLMTALVGSALGLTAATATTIASRAAYIGTQMAISAATSMLGSAVNAMILNTSTGFFSNLADKIEFPISVALGSLGASFALFVKQTAQPVLDTATDTMRTLQQTATSVDQTVTNTAEIVQDTVTSDIAPAARQVGQTAQAVREAGSRALAPQALGLAAGTYVVAAAASGQSGIPFALSIIAWIIGFRFFTAAPAAVP